MGLDRICISNRLPGADPAATLGEFTTLGSSRSRMFAQRKHITVSGHPYQQEAEALIMPILQMRALKHIEAKSHSQGHTDSRACTLNFQSPSMVP